jgi:hypothetical protein
LTSRELAFDRCFQDEWGLDEWGSVPKGERQCEFTELPEAKGSVFERCWGAVVSCDLSDERFEMPPDDELPSEPGDEREKNFVNVFVDREALLYICFNFVFFCFFSPAEPPSTSPRDIIELGFAKPVAEKARLDSGRFCALLESDDS